MVRILSIDGGICGLIPALVLQHPKGHWAAGGGAVHFIAGSSTGGIMASVTRPGRRGLVSRL
jgi:hypothetical protein